jgi:2,4-dienoyl-CoA reductase (NADPH2)
VLLTEPVAIGSRRAPSRVVFGPHETNLGRARTISDRHVAYYARRAAGGTGVIVTETASVVADDWPYERAPLAGDCGPGWRAVADACRAAAPAAFGPPLLLGALGHAGAQGSSAYSQSVMWAPSRVADVVSREPPAALEQDGIDAIVAAFARAARVAVSAGLDGVEIDSGAWSLLRQFQSGLTNLRADGYGDDRLRFSREVVAAVREAVGPDHVVALRLSCDELAPWAGITPEQAAPAVASLAPSVDLLTVIRAGPFSTGMYRPDAHTPEATNRELCRAMRDAAAGQVPVVLQGSVVDGRTAQAALDEGVADLVEMTRAQIADARLVRLWRTGLDAHVRPCLLCNQQCHVRDPRNPLVSCVGDPCSGHETVDPDVDPDRPDPSDPPGPSDRRGHPEEAGRPVLVVGGGPAGMECARVLAGRGRHVRLAERTGALGGALVIAAVGSGRTGLRRLTDWLAAECARLGVDVVLDTDVDAAAIRAALAGGWDAVIATGSRPFPGRYRGPGGLVVVDALQLLHDDLDGLNVLPAGPVVIDDPIGDAAGVGVAEWLAAATDRPVTIVTPDPVAGTLLARTGDLADANVRLQRAGVARQLRSRITSVADDHVTVVDVWTGAVTRLPAAVLVDCGHRLPDERLFEEVGDPGVRRAGDCVAPRTVHEAVLEGRRAAVSLLEAVPATVSP